MDDMVIKVEGPFEIPTEAFQARMNSDRFYQVDVEDFRVPVKDGVCVYGHAYRHVPDQENDNEKLGVAVVTVHPYAKMGGCEDLMQGVATQLARYGILAITFNTRGVGRSTGQSSLSGRSEVEDILAVVDYVIEKYDMTEIVLYGSSAGSVIAGRCLDLHPSIKCAVFTGYLFGFFTSVLFGFDHSKALLSSKKPKHFIMGSKDCFTSERQFKARMESATEPTTYHIVRGVGHFSLEAPAYDALVVSSIRRIIEKYSYRRAGQTVGELSLEIPK